MNAFKLIQGHPSAIISCLSVRAVVLTFSQNRARKEKAGTSPQLHEMGTQFVSEGLMSALSQMSNCYDLGSSESFSVDCFFSLFGIFSNNVKIHVN